ncbi:MAG: MFS transporter, partial [Acidobacteriota bacterium]
MRSRLAAYWFAYMAGFGIFFPFYTLYLRQDLGLTESRVGLVVAVIPLVGLIAQPAWGRVADATGSRRHVMAVLALGVALASVGLGLAGGFWPILLATALFALFSTSAMPMATSVTLAAEAHRGGAAVFGPIRAIGTLGFLIAVQLFPFLLDALETLDRPFRDLGWMFPTIAACTLPAALVALSLRDVGEMTLRSHRGDLGRLWRHPPFVRLLVFLFAAHLCMQGPIRLFPLLVDARGGGVT